MSSIGIERQLTHAPHGHILTNIGVWSPDGEWVVYDVRSDRSGSVFDGTRIEQVHIQSGEVRLLYESKNGACCGVVTTSPHLGTVIFIHGPEHPTPDWQYAAFHRRGVLVEPFSHAVARNLDARDLVPPFTPGALRGGSHVHTFSGDGQWISFTYEDHVLATLGENRQGHTSGEDQNQRNVGVSVPIGAIDVGDKHPRNHNGQYFSVLVTRTTNQPRPGSDEISRAFSDAWIGRDGYIGSDGSHQKRAIAFQGQVVTAEGKSISEVFVVDLPDSPEKMKIPDARGPLEGTSTRRPLPPAGVVQRRLTFTSGRRFPGIRGPRHWLRSNPDGSQIAFLMPDEGAVIQVWTVSPSGGPPVQVTRNTWDVASAFSWSPDGRHIAYVMNGSVFVSDVATGQSTRVTERRADETPPRPEACVFSPDGKRIAYVRTVSTGDQTKSTGDQTNNQVFAVELR